MTHLGKGEIGDFLTGRLEPADRQRVLHHLGGCSPCRRRLRVAAEILLGDEPCHRLRTKPREALAEGEGEARTGTHPSGPSLRRAWGRELPLAASPGTPWLAVVRGLVTEELRGTIHRP
ncbi:MAG: hypothetical protein DMF53_18485 [Acidobacteria bacterium]|nr:MAG: hypothetical protein DMF53_18485 [Acidobacteriota bacterium]